LREAVGQFGVTCVFCFVALGLYVQLTGNAMSFLALLPSSLLVAAVLLGSRLIFAPSGSDYRIAMIVSGIAFGSVFIGVVLAFLLSFFPALIAFQWHLLKRL
jgi:hypothetical protein